MPDVFVGRLEETKGRCVLVDEGMREATDALVKKPVRNKLTKAGREALRKRAIAAMLEMSAVIKEAHGVSFAEAAEMTDECSATLKGLGAVHNGVCEAIKDAE